MMHCLTVITTAHYGRTLCISENMEEEELFHRGPEIDQLLSA